MRGSDGGGGWRRLKMTLWESFAISIYSTHLETSVTGELSPASGNRPCRPTAYVFQMHVQLRTLIHEQNHINTELQSPADINAFL